jgi:hypothetical protein
MDATHLSTKKRECTSTSTAALALARPEALWKQPISGL